MTTAGGSVALDFNHKKLVKNTGPHCTVRPMTAAGGSVALDFNYKTHENIYGHYV